METLPVPGPGKTDGTGHHDYTAPTAEQFAEMMPETHDLREFFASLEKAVLQRALKMTGGAQAEVARRLGLSRSDLSYKLGKHRIKISVD